MNLNIESYFWGENFYKHPPLTDEMINKAESALNVRLPKRLIQLLKVQNGGYTQGFVFPMSQKTSWAEDHIPLDELFGIVPDKSIGTAQNILDSEYLINEWNLPENQVLISGDGHSWIALDYRKSGVPKVRWIDVDFDLDLLISKNFDDFINGLIPNNKFTG